MKIYLLWFNEWEANYILGIFETKQEAERWEKYFMENPVEVEHGPDFEYYSKRDDYKDRFGIQECVIGQLHDGITVDNLKLLEWEAQKKSQEISK